MKKFAIALLLLTIPILGSGHFFPNRTYQELFDQADLVVIGMPISTEDTNEPGLPGWKLKGAVGVITEFQVSVVMKGDKALKKFALHHYRWKNPVPIPDVPPHLVVFEPPFDPETTRRFLLFLKLESDGRYAPVSGQTDPELYDVLKLNGIAR